MIIRELKNNPELINNFDFFNDYKDTKAYLIRNNLNKLLAKLEKGHKKWLDKRRKKILGK